MFKKLFISILITIIFSGISYGYSEHKDWGKYDDNKLNFSIEYPKDWNCNFFYDEFTLQAGGLLGILTKNFGKSDYDNITIDFMIMKHDSTKEFNQVIQDSLSNDSKVYFQVDKVNNDIYNKRIGFCYLNEPTNMVIRQFFNIDKETTLMLEATLWEDSFRNRNEDEKFKSVMEIMDTLKRK